jgi:O-antigen/teichoic acid export membrane protein
MIRSRKVALVRHAGRPAHLKAGLSKENATKDLRQRTLRGVFAKLLGQGVNFVLRASFMMALARLLDPKDFGLVAMVTVVTGVYGLFTSAGLSSATVQKKDITPDQVSTLFWINILIGSSLAALCIATAPALVAFYREPRLFWVTEAMAAGFLVNAAGIQHVALLQRELRYVTLTLIEALSQLGSIAVGIGMAIAGLGYWALVAAALASPAITTVGALLTVAWLPGRPRWNVEIRSMLRFGCTITLNNLVVYLAYNFDKILLGRFWGADALGLYGRAFQLISLPSEYLNGGIGGVAFSALSRLQGDPSRLKGYFLKGYLLAISMTLPVTIGCVLFADEIVWIALGPNWGEAATIFRLLAPTVLVLGMINPIGWLLLSIGLQGRSLKLALVIAPLVMTAYAIGLPYGPTGVALSYSIAMTLWLVPHIVWCLHGTMISPLELARTVWRPFLSGIVAAILVFWLKRQFGPSVGPLPRLILGGSVMLAVYLSMLMLVLGQRAFYWELVKGLRKSPGAESAGGAEQVL